MQHCCQQADEDAAEKEKADAVEATKKELADMLAKAKAMQDDKHKEAGAPLW